MKLLILSILLALNTVACTSMKECSTCVWNLSSDGYRGNYSGKTGSQMNTFAGMADRYGFDKDGKDIENIKEDPSDIWYNLNLHKSNAYNRIGN